VKVQPKTVIWALVVVFVVYAVIISPETAADYVKAAFYFPAQAFADLTRFFQRLVG